MADYVKSVVAALLVFAAMLGVAVLLGWGLGVVIRTLGMSGAFFGLVGLCCIPHLKRFGDGCRHEWNRIRSEQ